MSGLTIPVLTPEVIYVALLILVLRLVGSAITTVRTLLVMRGRRWDSAGLGFLEALIFALTIGAAVQNLSNIWNLLVLVIPVKKSLPGAGLRPAFIFAGLLVLASAYSRYEPVQR